MKVLAIETSCDDTSAAVVDSSGFVHAMRSQNQDDIHHPYGGVIPELACRNHTLRLMPIIDHVLQDSGCKSFEGIDGIAVTHKPGLLGALLVGIATAKTLALSYKKTFVGVDHLVGHLHAPFVHDAGLEQSECDYPFLGLCVSGGHSSIYKISGIQKKVVLGQTLDDAAGEAFDKFGKVLGLGYPAGAMMDRMGTSGNPKAFSFPRALIKDKSNLDFSFSGLKTAGVLELRKHQEVNDSLKKDLIASYQEAIVDVLVEKLDRAQKKTKLKTVVITGGVACNTRLRTKAKEWAQAKNIKLLIPPPRYCTDNAAMIGYVGAQLLSKGKKDNFRLGPIATSRI